MKRLISLFILLAFGVFFLPGSASAYPGIPEPATMLLVGLCLVVLAGLGRKKFLKKQTRKQ